MTDTTHTPGPWATDGRDAGWNIVGLEGERVATVWRDGHNQPANARLIAAAPIMLDALWDILEAEEHDGDASVCDFQTLQSIARAAIAKATGQ